MPASSSASTTKYGKRLSEPHRGGTSPSTPASSGRPSHAATEWASVTADVGGQSRRFDADVVLLATGRGPRVDGLYIDKIGARVEKKGIEVNKYLEVGLDATDKALRTGQHGRAPAREEWLIIGHESLGRVVGVGPDVAGLREGDFIAATVRGPCVERCPPCIGAG